MKIRPPKARPGIVLIFVAGILTILAAIGTAFYATTHSSTTSAVRYGDMVRAELLAQSGIHEAAARLRQTVYLKTEDPSDSWSTVDWLHGATRSISFPYGNGKDDDGDGIVDNEAGKALKSYTRAMGDTLGDSSDRFTVEIEDAAGKINVNACDNLAVVLDNLCRAIGVPLVAAGQEALQPRRWYEEGAPAVHYAITANTDDTQDLLDRCFQCGADGKPVVDASGVALYGDGYAIAGHRARNGPFGSLDEVRSALTYVERNGNAILDDPLEKLEVESKFAALRPHITTGSWVDTQSVCVGKFEWVKDSVSRDVRNLLSGNLELGVTCQVLIDRDKSWVADDPVGDPNNNRGSLRGCYLALINGHGQGQLRRITTNGADWVAVRSYAPDEHLTIVPGPITSYMIIAPEDAQLEERQITPAGLKALFPRMNADGTFVDHPGIDYANRPLCIHRAPVNINTATDKVLTALFMGLNVQHGHPMSLGTGYPSSTATTTDLYKLSKQPRPDLYDLGASSPTLSSPCTIKGGVLTSYTDWYADDPNDVEPFLLTPRGLKRVPADSGMLVFDSAATLPAEVSGTPYDLTYLNNHGNLGLNEAHELTMRILLAREYDAAYPYIHRQTGLPLSGAAVDQRFDRGPFRNWDDCYFRVVKPWDDARLESGRDASNHYHKASVARMIMANFNSNLDLLKFNPGIEWIDRFGRNFTEMEPVMTFKGSGSSYGPGWVTYTNDPTYGVRAMRYKSDELIDKTDLNRSTTEFSFTSNGVFEMTSTGQVLHPITQQLLAERKVRALVKVYDVWRESTQDQFVRGTFSEAEGTSSPKLNSIGTASSSGPINRGRITRDRENDTLTNPKYKALDTLPEPVVPLTYLIPVDTGKYGDVIDGLSTDYGLGNWPGAGNLGHDVFGNAKSLDGGKVVPDVLANRVLPARYDGQIVLATNTCSYTPNDADVKDTFLASFDGDLDTATCVGNGREQAKTPKNPKIRVLDTISLLGLLNDQEEDTDPDAAANFPFLEKVPELPRVTSAADPDPITGDTSGGTAYWNHCSSRQGDLRPEGVHMGMLGTSYKDGILKYAAGQHLGRDKDHPPTAYAGKNYNPQSTDGGTITMWFKPEWHHDDFRNHEFFNATEAGKDGGPKSGGLWKVGRWWTVSGGGANRITNDLLMWFEDVDDNDRYLMMHGGWDEDNPSAGNLSKKLLPDSSASMGVTETAAYSVQPFRWNYVGCRFKGNTQAASMGTAMGEKNVKGLWHTWQDQAYFWDVENCRYLFVYQFVAGNWTGTSWDESTNGCYRSFMATQRRPEGPNYDPRDMYWFYMSTNVADPLLLKTIASVGSPAAFRWADGGASDSAQDGPTGEISRTACFALNPPNEFSDSWLYRNFPTDGTYAVIDELRIAQTRWSSERICAEQTFSRYYVPKNPESRNSCPQFTSQSLAESLRGTNGAACSERVVLARVSWNAFTPRFMHEWKLPSESGYTRKEIIASRFTNKDWGSWSGYTVPFRGPFSYHEYNRYVGLDAGMGWKSPAVNAENAYCGVDREYPATGTQPHSSKGVEMQILDQGTGTLYPSAALAYVDPSANNAIGSSASPAVVQAKDLHYRIIFRYPIDPNVDPKSASGAGRTDEAGRLTVNPDKHFMLDTPVFDDVSIVYFRKVRMLDYRSETE
jgi:hypothetical protein